MCKHCENVVSEFKGLDEFESMYFDCTDFAHLRRYKQPCGGFFWELVAVSLDWYTDEEHGEGCTVYFCPWCGRKLEECD